jgi:hypothetical protein
MVKYNRVHLSIKHVASAFLVAIRAFPTGGVYTYDSKLKYGPTGSFRSPTEAHIIKKLINAFWAQSLGVAYL